jgi:arginine decarboxylase
MATTVQETRSIDHFFSAPSGRTDRWRDLHAVARSWAKGDQARGNVETALDELGAIEEFHAFPGHELIGGLRERLQNDDANGFLALAKRISLAIITSNYKHDSKEWQTVDLSLADPVDVLPSSLGDTPAHRPYFEMLAVTPAPAGRWPHMAAEFRRLRRPEDAFVYETVMVGSLEDAVCAAVLNPDIAAVVIYEGFALKSRHDAPVLRSVLAAQQPYLDKADEADLALRLAAGLKAIRPELDIYLLSDRRVIRSRSRSNCISRCSKASRRATTRRSSTISSAMRNGPSAPSTRCRSRAASRSFGRTGSATWASSTASTSSWRRAAPRPAASTACWSRPATSSGRRTMAARAFGADHVFFVTNGTSTSNKMVVQALIAPGDIVILDRNCHKSHHYGWCCAVPSRSTSKPSR